MLLVQLAVPPAPPPSPLPEPLVLLPVNLMRLGVFVGCVRLDVLFFPPG